MPHPEIPERLAAIEEELSAHPPPHMKIKKSKRKASNDELCLVHTERLIEQIAGTAEKPFTQLDPDTYACSDSYQAARVAAGTLLESVDRVCRKKIDRVFALVRPPGHHAERDRAMGFCLFNNVALGAAYALSRHKKKRVAIFDFDVHHGNGTQHIFYDRPDVLYLSHHQYPFYPGTGNWSEIGEGNGKGMTVNCPLPAGCGDGEVLYMFDHLFEPVLRQYGPDILFLSAGFDAHERDPLAQLNVTDRGFLQLFLRLEKFARDTETPLIYTLEGGYDFQALARGASAAIGALESKIPLDSERCSTPLCLDLLRQARSTFSPFWEL